MRPTGRRYRSNHTPSQYSIWLCPLDSQRRLRCSYLFRHTCWSCATCNIGIATLKQLLELPNGCEVSKNKLPYLPGLSTTFVHPSLRSSKFL